MKKDVVDVFIKVFDNKETLKDENEFPEKIDKFLNFILISLFSNDCELIKERVQLGKGCLFISMRGKGNVIARNIIVFQYNSNSNFSYIYLLTLSIFLLN